MPMPIPPARRQQHYQEGQTVAAECQTTEKDRGAEFILRRDSLVRAPGALLPVAADSALGYVFEDKAETVARLKKHPLFMHLVFEPGFKFYGTDDALESKRLANAPATRVERLTIRGRLYYVLMHTPVTHDNASCATFINVHPKAKYAPNGNPDFPPMQHRAQLHHWLGHKYQGHNPFQIESLECYEPYRLYNFGQHDASQETLVPVGLDEQQVEQCLIQALVHWLDEMAPQINALHHAHETHALEAATQKVSQTCSTLEQARIDMLKANEAAAETLQRGRLRSQLLAEAAEEKQAPVIKALNRAVSSTVVAASRSMSTVVSWTPLRPAARLSATDGLQAVVREEVQAAQDAALSATAAFEAATADAEAACQAAQYAARQLAYRESLMAGEDARPPTPLLSAFKARDPSITDKPPESWHDVRQVAKPR